MVEDKAYELFITERESLVLEALVKLDVPFSQRAQALLAVDAGSTLEQASLVSGLRVTQVKYWLARFASGRLSIFPESVLEAVEAGLRSDIKSPPVEAIGGKVGGKSEKAKKRGAKKKEKKKKKLKAGVSKDPSLGTKKGKKSKKAKKKEKEAKASKTKKKVGKKQKKKTAGKKSSKKSKK